MSISFISKVQLQLSFTAIIFKVSTIRRLHGSLEHFAEKFALTGKTNGELFLTTHMYSIPDQSQINIDNFPELDGMTLISDYVVLQEELIRGVGGRYSPLIGHPVPGTGDCHWLESIITDKGNFIWMNFSELYDIYPSEEFLYERRIIDVLSTDKGIFVDFGYLSSHILRLDTFPFPVSILCFDEMKEVLNEGRCTQYFRASGKAPFSQALYGRYALFRRLMMEEALWH